MGFRSPRPLLWVAIAGLAIACISVLAAPAHSPNALSSVGIPYGVTTKVWNAYCAESSLARWQLYPAR